MPTIFSDLLTALRVRHTATYSDRRFRTMPFKTYFGLMKLLEEYGVECEGVRVASVNQLGDLPMPCIVRTRAGSVILTGVSKSAGTVSYMTQGVAERASLAELEAVATGEALVVKATEKSAEPQYCQHHIVEVSAVVKKWLFMILLGGIVVYLFIAGGLYSHVSTVLLTLFNGIGLTLSLMLMQKSTGFHNRHADAVCGVLQAGGCDSILKKKSSTFFGIVSWSEVGTAYFSISLGCLLLFPQYIGYLALCNLCCLPFTCWSIWYQKCHAKAWCTLCVSVQCTLWCLFFCYLGGGWLKEMFPLSWPFFILVAFYGVMLLGLNRLSPLLKRASSCPADNIPDLQ